MNIVIYRSEGTIINQNPLAGMGDIKEGDSINVVVSKGPKPAEQPSTDNSTGDTDSGDTNNSGTNSGRHE